MSESLCEKHATTTVNVAEKGRGVQNSGESFVFGAARLGGRVVTHS